MAENPRLDGPPPRLCEFCAKGRLLMRSKRLSTGLRAALAIFAVSVLVTSTWAVTHWSDKVLHNFNDNGTDGYYPYASLIFDAAGNLYGTTSFGGAYGYGTVFELTPTAGGGWTETVLHSFGNGTDGAYPDASLIFDAVGNLYGTTQPGGTYHNCNGGFYCGTVFELMPIYPCIRCSHSDSRESEVPSADRKAVLEQDRIEQP